MEKFINMFNFSTDIGLRPFFVVNNNPLKGYFEEIIDEVPILQQFLKFLEAV
jgi:hypothetical protein